MALTIILACLTIVNVLNLLLVLDLYGRSAVLAKMAQEARIIIMGMNHLLRKVTEEKDETI